MLSQEPFEKHSLQQAGKVGKGGGLVTSSRCCTGMCGISWGKLSFHWAIKIHLVILPAEEFTEFSASYYQVRMSQISFEWGVGNIHPIMIRPLWNVVKSTEKNRRVVQSQNSLAKVLHSFCTVNLFDHLVKAMNSFLITL